MPTDYPRAVRIARAAAGLTLAQLEARTGIDRANLSAMESGRRPVGPEAREAIAKATGLTVEGFETLASTQLRRILEGRWICGRCNGRTDGLGCEVCPPTASAASRRT